MEVPSVEEYEVIVSLLLGRIHRTLDLSEPIVLNALHDNAKITHFQIQVQVRRARRERSCFGLGAIESFGFGPGNLEQVFSLRLRTRIAIV